MHDGCKIMGVLNVTPDSFSDGGLYLDPHQALAHARALVDDGADVIDVGSASSHPDASTVPPELERERLEPVLRAIVGLGVAVSVDSFRPETQRYALAAGATWLNDIHAFADPAFHAELAQSDATLVLMHAAKRDRPVPAGRVLDHVEAFFSERMSTLTRAGVGEERLVLDPGMGLFLSPDPNVSLEVLHRLPELKCRLGRPLLIGVSRKSFLGHLCGRAVGARGAATLAAELFAVVTGGVDVVRTHDVAALRDGLRVWSAIECDVATRGGAKS